MRSEAQGEAVERGKVGAQLFRNSQKLFRGEPGNSARVTTLRQASERAQPPERVGEGNAMRGDGGGVERRSAGAPLSGTAKSCSGSARPSSRQRGGPKQTEA